MLSVWMLFGIKLIPMWKILSKAVAIEESTAKEFIDYGYFALILLAIFNALYLIEFISIKIIGTIF